MLYHDWEAETYDEKWSISFDERCIDYARDRFAAVAGTRRLALRRRRSRSAAAPASSCSTSSRRACSTRRTSPTSRRAWCAAAIRNGAALGFDVDGRVADAESIPYDDATFDLVVGHAVLHHIPDVELALREVLRVLKPGGRFVVRGRADDGRRLVRPPARSRSPGWRRPGSPTCRRCATGGHGRRRSSTQSSRAAALESVVDLHTFDPRELAATALRAGAVDVRTTTEELTAALFGWPVRTFEAAVNPDRLGWGWAMFAYRSWQRLSAVDRAARHAPCRRSSSTTSWSPAPARSSAHAS